MTFPYAKTREGVGVTGLEPVTSCMSSKHSKPTELYAPKLARKAELSQRKRDYIGLFPDWVSARDEKEFNEPKSREILAQWEPVVLSGQLDSNAFPTANPLSRQHFALHPSFNASRRWVRPKSLVFYTYELSDASSPTRFGTDSFDYADGALANPPQKPFVLYQTPHG